MRCSSKHRLGKLHQRSERKCNAMKAIAAHPPEKSSVRLIDAPVPRPGSEEALLSIHSLGIDGTDQDIDQGVYGSPPPGDDHLVIGHEAVGHVEEVGANVTSVSVGDLVVPTVRRPCPQDCENCRKGEMDLCSTGDYREHGIEKLHGFAAEYATSDARYLVKIPKDIEDVAVLLEPLSVAVNAVNEVYRIQQRMEWTPSKALVMGSGPLGLLTSMVLRLRGLEVHATATREQDSLKAEIVRQMGGRYINVRETPLSSMDERYDIVMEATGSVQAAMDALPQVERNGVICILGLYPEKEVCEGFGKFLTRMVLENILMFGSVSSNRDDFEQGIEDIKAIQERFNGLLSRLLTTQVQPEDFRRAFEADHEDIKTVIRFSP